MWVYLNNRFVSEAQAAISVFDAGFLYGDGLFETLRAYNGKIFLLSEHLTRLQKGAKRLAIPIPDAALLEKRLIETLEKNHLRDAMLRLTITRGNQNWGHVQKAWQGAPTLVIFARGNPGHEESVYQQGITGQIVTIRRNPKTAQDPALKAISFLNNRMAKQEAASHGADEAVLLNTDGYLAEGSVSNLFWICDGIVYTPAQSVGILAGVTRNLILKLAKKERLSVAEGFYEKTALLEADEAFLTNTGFEVMPLTRVNQKKIGNGKPGPITQKLYQAFLKKGGHL
ncbi:MAG: aminotransferase class IV [Nitrospirota bacterium]